MNDKERVKDLLVDIDSFLVENGGDDVIDNWDGQTPRTLLEFIKKNLEKMMMNDTEKIKEAVRLLDELEKNVEGWKKAVDSGYTKTRKMEHVSGVLKSMLMEFSTIKKILES